MAAAKPVALDVRSHVWLCGCIHGLVTMLATFQDQLIFYLTPTDASSHVHLCGLVLEGSVTHPSTSSPRMVMSVTRDGLVLEGYVAHPSASSLGTVMSTSSRSSPPPMPKPPALACGRALPRCIASRIVEPLPREPKIRKKELLPRSPGCFPSRQTVVSPSFSASFRVTDLLDGRDLCKGEVGICKELASDSPAALPSTMSTTLLNP
ncbi:hypothetical protein E2562_023834 [Oryza meyeriana var. granulata]|uniref:Uncharacterized protein n=1 Tax=Oryza meyeriana var. granulata TaxID=110450 RepID=A0A6G1D753_9ORYZ|nr:hypothetical protein E2562_023834 [Oryza meyeriana var. granulata]